MWSKIKEERESLTNSGLKREKKRWEEGNLTRTKIGRKLLKEESETKMANFKVVLDQSKKFSKSLEDLNLSN